MTGMVHMNMCRSLPFASGAHEVICFVCHFRFLLRIVVVYL
jgi:hypothetical protein